MRFIKLTLYDAEQVFASEADDIPGLERLDTAFWHNDWFVISEDIGAVLASKVRDAQFSIIKEDNAVFA